MKKMNIKSKWFTLSIISILLYTGLNIYVAFSLKGILDLVETQDFSNFNSSVIRSALIILLMAVSYFLKGFATRRFTASELKRASTKIFSNILNSVEITNSGETISFLTNDLNLAISSQLNMVFSLVENGMLFLFALISLYFLEFRVAIMVLLLSIILTFLPRVFSKSLSKRRERQVQDIGKMNNQFSNTLNGMDTIKSYSVEEIMSKDTDSFVKKAEKSLWSSSIFGEIVNNFIFGASFISQILVIIFTATLILKGYLTIGVILLVGQLMSFVQEPISSLLSARNEFNANEEIFKKLESMSETERAYGLEKKNNLERSISIKNLHFSYGEKEIFSDLNLEFEKGKKYAILGKSGTGKTTLFKLLTGELTPTDGEVLIDNIKVKDLDKNSIQKIYQKVSQNLFLFSNSIKYNISLTEDFKDLEYEEALRKAQIFDRIEKLPEKSDTVFEESKIILSGGEKQRLQIARALLRDREVFLFDEITSNLDLENSLSIEKTISELGQTIISIRHKIDESLKYYDEIIILENGSARMVDYDDIA